MQPMRLTFLGTAGSEGYPAAFCECARCVSARRQGGKNIRRRSSLLIDDDLLLDLGPDVPSAIQALGLTLAGLRHVLITHAHDDHFVPIQLKYRHARYGAPSLAPLTVFGSRPSLARLNELPMACAELDVHELIDGLRQRAGLAVRPSGAGRARRRDDGAGA